MSRNKLIECVLVVTAWAACSACGTTPAASLGGVTSVTEANALLPATGINPNSAASGAPQFSVTTNWAGNDPNLTTSSPGINFLVAANPNLCIDIPSGNTNPNEVVQTWACNGYDPAQAWFLYGGQLHSQSGLCLDVAGDDINTAVNVVTQACDTTGTRQGQQWNYAGGLLQITNSSRCLSLSNPNDGVQPVLADCDYPDIRQNWIGARSDGNNIRGVVISTQVSNSACLYVADSSAAGTTLTLQACDYGVMEQFVLEGTHLLALGKCVQASDSVGSSLTIEDCSDAVTQQWVWNSGTLQLAADLSKCVGLVGGNAANGAPVQVQSCSKQTAQQWSLGTSGY